MGEDLRAALAIVTMAAGMALIAYAGYLHYVALPGEHAARHVITRSALLVVGFTLAVLGAGILP